MTSKYFFLKRTKIEARKLYLCFTKRKRRFYQLPRIINLDGFSFDGYNIFQANNKESKCYKSYIFIMGCAATFELGQRKISLPYSVFRTITSTFGFEESLSLQ